MNDDMIPIQIQAGCPSGVNMTRSVLHVHKSLVRDFIDNLMEYARQEAKADHWEVKE
tara:strand:+ start:9015 stop:9185 length:171 start_codon:yes stop_codon:yes gene_type:complete